MSDPTKDIDGSSADWIGQLRGPKFLGMAIFDWLMTMIVVLIIAVIFRLHYGKSLLVTIIIAIITHYTLNVDTQLNCYLGLNPCLR